MAVCIIIIIIIIKSSKYVQDGSVKDYIIL